MGRETESRWCRAASFPRGGPIAARARRLGQKEATPAEARVAPGLWSGQLGPDSGDLAAAIRAGALRGGLAILHRNGLGIFDFLFGFTLNTICFHSDISLHFLYGLADRPFTAGAYQFLTFLMRDKTSSI